MKNYRNISNCIEKVIVIYVALLLAQRYKTRFGLDL